MVVLIVSGTKIKQKVIFGSQTLFFWNIALNQRCASKVISARTWLISLGSPSQRRSSRLTHQQSHLIWTLFQKGQPLSQRFARCNTPSLLSCLPFFTFKFISTPVIIGIPKSGDALLFAARMDVSFWKSVPLKKEASVHVSPGSVGLIYFVFYLLTHPLSKKIKKIATVKSHQKVPERQQENVTATLSIKSHCKKLRFDLKRPGSVTESITRGSLFPTVDAATEKSPVTPTFALVLAGWPQSPALLIKNENLW